jgi:hypothetical protein
MRAATVFLVAFVMMAGLTSAEKGDTYTAEMSSTTLPPGGPYIPGKVRQIVQEMYLLDSQSTFK